MKRKSDIPKPHVLGYDVYFLNRSRMAAQEEYRQKMETIAQQEKRIEAILLAVAPPTARRYLKESLIIQNLFAYGKAERKIVFGECPGMGSLARVKKAMRELGKAWKGVVDIKLCTPESHRVEVKFSATRL